MIKKRRARKLTALARESAKVARDHLDLAENYLQLAARHIDTAGDLAGTEQADMLACYASNVLQWSLALIRELRASLKASPVPPGGERR